MEPIATEMVRKRKCPSHPELMHTTCPVLGLVSALYPSSVHGYSTTIMASMFKFEYLFANLAPREMCGIVAHIYKGFPVQWSAYDGLYVTRMIQFAAPQSPLLSPRDLESYIESVFGSDVDIQMMLREPATPIAVQADGKEDIEGREDDELVMTGFETLDCEDLDCFISGRGCYGNPCQKTIKIPGLDADLDNDECDSVTSVSLVTPVDGVGSKRTLSQTPPPHYKKHISIAKKLRSVSSSRLLQERKLWSAQEDECIMVYYEKHGAKWRDMARTMAAETLSSRSDDALRNRYYRLTAHRDKSPSTTSSESSSSRSTTVHKACKKRVSWTVAEDELILEMVYKFGDRLLWKQVAELLPGRTSQAIRNRANRLFMERERTDIMNALPLEKPQDATGSAQDTHQSPVEVGLKLAGWRDTRAEIKFH